MSETTISHPTPVETLKADQILSREAVQWTQPGFDLRDTIHKLQGSFIEVAGPTNNGYEMLAAIRLPKRVFTSNFYTPDVTNLPKPDFLADSGRLPVADGSVGMLLESAMSSMVGKEEQPEIWDRFFKEADRVLEPGGLVIAQATNEAALRFAESNGLEIVYCDYEKGEAVSSYGEQFNDVITYDLTGGEDPDDEIVSAVVGQSDFIFRKPKVKNNLQVLGSSALAKPSVE